MVCDEIIDFGMRPHYLTVVLFWSSTISITVGSQASHGLLTVARGRSLDGCLTLLLGGNCW